MTPIDVKYVDVALARMCAMRESWTPIVFYEKCDRLLDMRNAAALVVKLEAEHAEHVELVGAR